MNIAVDIGNSTLKCQIYSSSEHGIVHSWTIPAEHCQLNVFVEQKLFYWGESSEQERLLPGDFPAPVTWRIIQSGKLAGQDLKGEILKIRPKDQFQFITRGQIPLKTDVETPDKVGIDRLVAAFAAIRRYSEPHMMIVDAGTAITVDIVFDKIFCGGAILPGLNALANIYPQISDKLPLISIPEFPVSLGKEPPLYPGKNTQDAVQSGLYWGTVGAIRQFYDIIGTKIKNLRLIVTGGDSKYLMHGLTSVIPVKRISHHEALPLEGIALL